MTWLPSILTVFHVIVSIFLILVVLLQQGKSADWSGAFGGGGSQATFGSRGTGTLLSKATTAAAIIFMITSLALTILISRPGGSSVIREGAQQKNQPAQPVQPPAPAPGQPPAQPPAQQGQPAQPAPPPAPQQQQQKSTPAPPATPEKK
ncbi:MAG TPA: preprotein translocase subunit SecG [Terriglobia bacterium]|nr:preprotein translocase subunit SecG [Terriglobia bacterium]